MRAVMILQKEVCKKAKVSSIKPPKYLHLKIDTHNLVLVVVSHSQLERWCWSEACRTPSEHFRSRSSSLRTAPLCSGVSGDFASPSRSWTFARSGGGPR